MFLLAKHGKGGIRVGAPLFLGLLLEDEEKDSRPRDNFQDRDFAKDLLLLPARPLQCLFTSMLPHRPPQVGPPLGCFFFHEGVRICVGSELTDEGGANLYMFVLVFWGGVSCRLVVRIWTVLELSEFKTVASGISNQGLETTVCKTVEQIGPILSKH